MQSQEKTGIESVQPEETKAQAAQPEATEAQAVQPAGIEVQPVHEVEPVSPGAATVSHAAIWNDPPALLLEFGQTRDIRLRNRLVELHERLVHYVANRMGSPGGMTPDDVAQVGYMGLIAAIERYDPEKGGSFVSFAVPTMIGVIKHYLRDNTWGVKVPRRLRERGIALRSLRDRLEKTLGRSPSIQEMADASGLTEEKLLEAMDLELVYQPASLDVPVAHEDGDGASSYLEYTGEESPEYDRIEQEETMRQALAQLNPRERFIIANRFYGESSQADVAAKLGISQMHVSRLERQALTRLRQLLR